jgi:aspartyl-tRNA(Asn)/glutamyl-tRNA(Gln) amidotransferase subunit B
MTGDLKKVLNYNELTYGESDLGKSWIEYMLELVDGEKISDRNAEMLLREVVEKGKNPEEIVEKKDLLKAEDDEISEFVEAAIEENPDAVDDYESGEEEAINFLVGQVMQKSQGKADPKTAREKILEELE